MGKSQPFMKLYWNDLIASTVDMTCQEFGAYMRLLGYQWQHGFLPMNDVSRQRVTGVSTESWPSVWKSIEHRFNVDLDGRLTQSRLAMERDAANASASLKAKTARENGKLGGRPKNPITQEKPTSVIKTKPSSGSGSRSKEEVEDPEEKDSALDLKRTEGCAPKDLENHSKGHKSKAFDPAINPPSEQEWLEYGRGYVDQTRDKGEVADAAIAKSMDFYLANGWRQSKGNAIKDWRAACRTCINNERDRLSRLSQTPQPESKGHQKWKATQEDLDRIEAKRAARERRQSEFLQNTTNEQTNRNELF